MTNAGNNARLLEVIKTQTEVAQLGLDLGSVMALVTERSQKLTDAIGAIIELAEGDDMVYRAATGTAQRCLGLRLARASSLSGRCMLEGNPLRCDDSENDARVDREACRRVGLRSMVVVPLRHHQMAIGVLKVISDRIGTFDESDVEILALMSDLIAASMFHAAKYETSKLFFQATHDALTGLANRALFYDRLRACLARAARERACFGILNLDMDGLKPINDTHGHRAGDAAIREFAARLKHTTRESDVAARLGGDEFGLILSRLDDRDGALTHAHRIHETMRAPFAFEQNHIALDASIGVAIFPEDGEELDALVDKADQSMYEMKRSRKSQLE
jgi:diguanylate cyclase (GGDEF)-like protein